MQGAFIGEEQMYRCCDCGYWFYGDVKIEEANKGKGE
jgi:hypothetical protein